MTKTKGFKMTKCKCGSIISLNFEDIVKGVKAPVQCGQWVNGKLINTDKCINCINKQTKGV